MVRHRISYALALAALLVLGQGGVALADANAWWTPAFNDPARVDISDIGGLIAETVLYSNPMDDLCRGLLVLLRPTGRVVLASALAIDELSLRAHRPRAPPAV